MNPKRGSQAVELALVTPLLLLLMTGGLDLAWYFSVDMALFNAVRDGAQYGSRTLQTVGPALAAKNNALATWRLGTHADVGMPTFEALLEGAAPMQVLRIHGRLAYEPLFGLVPIPVEHRTELVVRMVEQP
ncbi:MAG: TadE/TadG family type IV pilus assembly protein [Myxococcota bacterium]